MTNTTCRVSLLAVCLALTLASAAEEPRIIPLFRYGSTSQGVGQANLVAADLDGDGRADLVSCSNGAPFAISAKNDTYVTTWIAPDVGCNALTVADRDGDGGADVITSGGLTVSILDPRRLAGPVTTLTIPGTEHISDVAAGNVDGDAATEIVVVTSAATHVYDGATLALQWSANGFGGWEARIGDVDGTTQREIIVNGETGHVLDAVAKSEKWGYVGGFGYSYELANVDADAKAEIVFRARTYQTTITILHGDTFATSSWTTPHQVDTLAVADANGDGAVEIILGNNQWGDIEAYSPAGGSRIWYIDNPGHGTSAIGTGDLNGDNKLEVFWGADLSSSAPDTLYIGDAQHTQFLWRSPDDIYAPYASATGDLDGDGRAELVLTTLSIGGGYNASAIGIFDIGSGVQTGTLPMPNGYATIGKLAVAQLDADPAPEIAAVAGSYLMTWDGVTRQHEFTSSSSLFSYNSTEPMLIANIDADAVSEVFVSAGEQIYVLNGASNVIQKTLQVSGYCRAMALADLNGDARLELVLATSSGLTIYDTGTWAVLGSKALLYIAKIAATPAAGGTVAVTYESYPGNSLQVLKGLSLTVNYTCDINASEITFGSVDGETRLLAATRTGLLRFLPLSGGDCASLPPAVYATSNIQDMQVVDVMGDGRSQLLVNATSSASLALLGAASETRGDADGDGVITVDDVDAVFDFVFGEEDAIAPAADANADQRIGIEDMFRLIDHELAGGEAPQP